MKLSFSIVLIFLSAVAFSQGNSTADGFYFFRQDSSTYQEVLKSGTFLRNYENDKSGSLSLSRQKESGHYRLSQMPESAQYLQLSADGLRQLGKFELAGKFSYGQAKFDSVSFNNRASDPLSHPFYFVNIKAGKYTNQNYQAKGIVSYAIISDKLFIASNFDYKYTETNRSVDPRLSATQFKFILAPEISYRYKQHLLGISLTKGYGDEAISVKYKNLVYASSELYPDRFSYINYGYGNIARSTTNFIRRQKYTGAGIHYTGSLNQWKVYSGVSYLLTDEENREPLTNSVKSQKLSDFQLSSTAFSLLLHKKRDGRQTQLRLDGQLKDGSDFLVKVAGKNYTYSSKNAAVNWSEAFKHLHQTFELSFYSQYQEESRRDAFVDHNSAYSFIRSGLSMAYYQQKENYRFSALLGSSFRKALSHNLRVPITQETWFTRSVVYPDFYYYSGNSISFNYGLDYTFLKLFSKMKAGLRANGSYGFESQNAKKTLMTDFNADGHRLYSQLSLNLYF